MYLDETAWVAIAFIIIIALVWKKASKAIVSILDDRSVLIQNELQEAKSLKEEALEELRKSLQTQKKVSEEAENIIREAKETAKKIQEEAYSKSSDVIKRKEDQAKQKIIALETDAIKKIKKITGKVIIESSKIYIESNIDKKEKVNLITKSSNEIKPSLLV